MRAEVLLHHFQVKKRVYLPPTQFSSLLVRSNSRMGVSSPPSLFGSLSLLAHSSLLFQQDYDEFCLPYQQFVVQQLKARHPDLPVIMYIKNSGALLERMAQRYM